MFDLTGKNALVTGAAGGLGRSIATMLVAQGAKVALVGRNIEGLTALKNELGDKAVIVTGDLASPDAPAQILKEAEGFLGGGVDILVNNAGLTRDGLAMRMKDEDWEAVLNVNLTATFRLCRAALKGMMGRRYGRIVNIASIVGVTGNAGQANYAASKGGMIAMSKSLAQEIASRGITVNCVAPGFIVTPMTDALTDDQKQKLLGAIPTGFLGEPQDVASAVLYLASAEARYVTGQTLNVNGGMAMI